MMSLLLFPLRLVWGFIGFLFSFLGILLSLIIGGVVIIAGICLTATIIGAIIGIPLIISGFLLIVKSILS